MVAFIVSARRYRTSRCIGGEIWGPTLAATPRLGRRSSHLSLMWWKGRHALLHVLLRRNLNETASHDAKMSGELKMNENELGVII